MHMYAKGLFAPRTVLATLHGFSLPPRNANQSTLVDKSLLDVYLTIVRDEKYDAQLFISFAY